MKKSLLVINSNDKVSGSTTDFRISLKNFHKRIKSITPIHTTVPNLFHNVVEGSNNLRFLVNGVTEYNFTPAPGFYTSRSWYSAFQSFLSNLGLNVVQGQEELNEDKITSATTLKLNLTTDFDMTIIGDGTTMWKMLGLNKGEDLAGAADPITPTNFTLVSPHNVDFKGVGNVFVHLNLTRENGWSSKGNGEHLPIIDMMSLHDTDFGDIVHVKREDEDVHEVVFQRRSDPPNVLDFKLTDEFNNVLSLPENTNVCLIYQIIAS